MSMLFALPIYSSIFLPVSHHSQVNWPEASKITAVINVHIQCLSYMIHGRDFVCSTSTLIYPSAELLVAIRHPLRAASTLPVDLYATETSAVSMRSPCVFSFSSSSDRTLRLASGW